MRNNPNNQSQRDEAWLKKYQQVIQFIETNRRNPSRYVAEERGLYMNWMKHKLYNAGEMKADRVQKFKELLELSEKNKRVNQYL